MFAHKHRLNESGQSCTLRSAGYSIGLCLYSHVLLHTVPIEVQTGSTVDERLWRNDTALMTWAESCTHMLCRMAAGWSWYLDFTICKLFLCAWLTLAWHDRPLFWCSWMVWWFHPVDCYCLKPGNCCINEISCWTERPCVHERFINWSIDIYSVLQFINPFVGTNYFSGYISCRL